MYKSAANHLKTVAAAMLAAVLLLAGCATNNYPPATTAQEFDYIVGPGDSLDIFVWGNPELSTGAKIRPDGKFTTRLVEDIPASGMTSTELARAIEESYSKYVKNPVVTVIVNGFVGVPTQQVRIIGAASKPKNIPFRKHMTVLDMMIDVGGLSEFASGNKAVLVRYSDDGEKTYTLRLEDLIEGDITANAALMPGDIVIIPEAWF